MMKKIHYVLTALILLALVAGCSSEYDWDDHEKVIDKGDEILLTLDLTVPGIANPETFALTKADENELKTIDLLVFKDNGAGNDETFLYHTHATDIQNNAGASNKKFKAQIQKSTGSEKHRIVLIVNARNNIDAVKAGFLTTMTKAEVLEIITFDSNIKWNTTNTNDFTPLPMWGETAGTHVITATTTGLSIGTIKLLRSVARIDVGLNMDNNDVPQGFVDLFKIEDVKVYNANNKSAIAPLEANVTANKVTLPSLVTGAQTVTPAIAYSHTTPDFGLVREIYIGEANNKTQTDDDKMMCVIVGGYYTKVGDPVNTTTKTWYRIDFYDRSTTPQDRLDMLRNHRYKVNITAVDGPGYDTEAEAFNSRPINMDTEIIAWDEGDMNDVTADGQYQLTVDKSEVTLYEEGNLNPQKLKIYTDHPLGWKIDYNSITWIQVSPDNDLSATELEVDVTASPYLSQPNPREAGFWIKAGKLKKWIKVIQLNQPELTIDVTPTSIIFRKSGAQAKSIVVTTYPATSQVNFSEIQGTSPIAWLAGAGFPVSGLQNIGTYQFQPDVNNTGGVLSGTVTVYIQDAATGNMASKTVTVTQLATDLLFAATPTNPYPAIGGASTFSVDSDTPWQIASVTDPNTAMNGAFDNTPKSAGTNMLYAFTLLANQTWNKKTVTFTPSSTDIDFAGQPIVVEQGHANPSMVLNKTTIAFGSDLTPAAQAVTATSNAKWSYATTGQWALTVESSTPAAGVEQGAHTYNTTGANTVTFTPKAWTAVAGTLAAGSTLVGTATFTTSDHAPATAASQALTVSRQVPAFFTYNSVSPATVSRTGGTVTASANTNAAWKVTSGTGGVSASNAGTAYATGKTTTVAVGENKTWSATTAAVSRPVNIVANYGLTISTMTAAGGTKQITQPGYYISAVSAVLPNFPLAYGGTGASVTLTGAYPAIATRAVVNGTNTVVSSATPNVAAGESGARAASFTINANTTWSDRQVVCQYANPRSGTAVWTNAGTYVWQNGYEVTASSATAVTSADGGTSTISITGYRPTLSVHIIGTPIGISGTVSASTHAVGSATLTVPANTGAARTLTARYMHPVNGATVISSWVQNAQPPYYTLPSGLKVSRAIVSGMSIFELCGQSSNESLNKCNEIMGEAGWSPNLPFPIKDEDISAYASMTGDKYVGFVSYDKWPNGQGKNQWALWLPREYNNNHNSWLGDIVVGATSITAAHKVRCWKK